MNPSPPPPPSLLFLTCKKLCQAVTVPCVPLYMWTKTVPAYCESRPESVPSRVLIRMHRAGDGGSDMWKEERHKEARRSVQGPD